MTFLIALIALGLAAYNFVQISNLVSSVEEVSRKVGGALDQLRTEQLKVDRELTALTERVTAAK